MKSFASWSVSNAACKLVYLSRITPTYSCTREDVMSRVAPELVQQRLVRQVVDVLHVVVRLILTLRLFPGLPRVDALQDAQPPACENCQKALDCCVSTSRNLKELMKIKKQPT